MRAWILAAAVLLAPGAGAVGQVTVLALTRGQAILDVDGARRVLRVGETSPEGVRLVSADPHGAVVEYGGRRERLGPDVVVSPIREEKAGRLVSLWQAEDGFFYAWGSINGQSVRFLVDTGASVVAISRRDATRLGLDFRRGPAGLATTAGGTVRAYEHTLSSVRVGDIELRDVPAGVVDSEFPAQPLLGMSFLGQVEMRRAGRELQLIRK